MMNIKDKSVFDSLNINEYEELIKIMDRIFDSGKLNEKDKNQIKILCDSLREKHDKQEALSDNIAKIRNNILDLNKLRYQSRNTQTDLNKNISQIEIYDRLIMEENEKLQNLRGLFMKDVYMLEDILRGLDIEYIKSYI